MGKQARKVDARRTVMEAFDGIRKGRVERDRRISRLAVSLVAAIGERDEAIATAEVKASDAVQALIGEDLTVADISALCGGRIGVRDLTRLSRRSDSASATAREG